MGSYTVYVLCLYWTRPVGRIALKNGINMLPATSFEHEISELGFSCWFDLIISGYIHLSAHKMCMLHIRT